MSRDQKDEHRTFSCGIQRVMETWQNDIGVSMKGSHRLNLGQSRHENNDNNGL